MSESKFDPEATINSLPLGEHTMFKDLVHRVGNLETINKEQTAFIREIRTATSEILEVFTSLKGFWSVLNWIGRAAKPLAALGSMFGGYIYLKDHVKDIFK